MVNIRKLQQLYLYIKDIIQLSFYLITMMIMILFGKYIKELKEEKCSGKFELEAEKPKICFKNLNGCSRTQDELSEIVAFIKNKKSFKEKGLKTPKGILFYGPPGNGKTVIAKAFAGEADCHFISISAAEFDNNMGKTGAAKVKLLFNYAKQFKKCVIFLDELDALGSRENENNKSNQTIIELLIQFNNINDNVFVIAATNHHDHIDSALIRTGRFDKKIKLHNPNKEERMHILKTNIENKETEKDLNIEEISELTENYSISDLVTLVNEAGLLAFKQNKKINLEIFTLAHQKLTNKFN